MSLQTLEQKGQILEVLDKMAEMEKICQEKATENANLRVKIMLERITM